MKINITLGLAKNGEQSCKINEIFMCSKYNPSNEAKNFVNSIDCNYNPSVVILINPCLSHCFSFIKERFPTSEIIAIQCVKNFIYYDAIWDHVLYYNNPDTLSERIYSLLGEEKLFSTLVSLWLPSDKIFLKENTLIFKSIQKAILKSRDVIATRLHFNLRWSLNSVRFFQLLHNVSLLQKGTQTVFLAASGPSLKESFDFMQLNRRYLFVVALSSACKALLDNTIVPDIAISTDGGYYAKRHLDCITEHKIPVILSAESAFSAILAKKTTIIPICYGDSLETLFFKQCKVPNILASRNGTVSGTAIDLFLNITTSTILTGGLDLCINKEFLHVNPNILEEIDSVQDNCIRPIATRIAENSFKTGSLSIYRLWFQNLDTKKSKRIVRLYTEPDKQIHLSGIKDITFTSAKNLIKTNFQPILISNPQIINNHSLKISLHNFLVHIQNNLSTYEYNTLFMENAALVEVLLSKKYPDKKQYLENTKLKTDQFIQTLLYKIDFAY